MVAEPVLATVEMLNLAYSKAADFILALANASYNTDIYDKVSKFNPFAEDHHFQPSKSLWDKVADHIVEHRVSYVSVLTVGIGLGGYFHYKSTASEPKNGHRRRVRKLPNGARRDAVLLVGSPTEPLTRLMALDLEKRGFIVYLTILDEKDEKYVEANSIMEDLNYLNLSDSYSFDVHLSKFRKLLQMPVVPFVGAEPHTLNLLGIVLAPLLYFPIGPIENITVASWLKVNERLNVYLKLLSSGLVSMAREHNSKLVVVYPNVVRNLTIPYHAPEAVFQSSVHSLFTALSRELYAQSIPVTHIRMGNLNVSSHDKSYDKSKISSLVASEMKGWNSDVRSIYADRFAKAEYRANPIRSTGKGTSLRDFYHTVFDVLYSKNPPSVIYCGTGARTYEWILRFLPQSFLDLVLR